MKKNLFVIFLIFVTFFSVYFIFFAPVSFKKNEVRVVVSNGMTLKSLSQKLKAENLIRSDLAFYALSKIYSKNGFVLRSGVYKVDSSLSSLKNLKKIVYEKQEFVKISFPEGLTLTKIANLLEKNQVCKKDDFLNVAKNSDLLLEYKIPAKNFEGFLFPDTYFFVEDMEAKSVLKIMADNFFSQIQKIPEAKNVSGEELFSNVILASIVEREYRVESEAPLIASVFKNRIEAGMGLGSCATIEFIITEILGKNHPEVITYEDLQIDSPYNTYKWAALPPGAISNPGLVALRAVFQTPKTDYFYFRLLDEENGTHIFSKNFSGHKNAAKNFRTKKAAQ